MTSVELQKKYDEVGLFHACYFIGTGLAGAPGLSVNLLVNAVERHITGVGSLFLDQPETNKYRLEGDFNYLCTMDNCHILATIDGYPYLMMPPGSGIGPVLLPELKLRVLFDEEFSTGIASYQYTDKEGKPHYVNDVPVRKEECNRLPNQ